MDSIPLMASSNAPRIKLTSVVVLLPFASHIKVIKFQRAHYKHIGRKYFAQENVKLRQSRWSDVFCHWRFLMTLCWEISPSSPTGTNSRSPHWSHTKTNGNLLQWNTMLHPAQSINRCQKAPTLKMECTDVLLIDRRKREGKGVKKGAVEGKQGGYVEKKR